MLIPRSAQRIFAAAFAALCLPVASANAQGAPAASTAAPRNGARDLDFEFGSWKTHLRRPKEPLSGTQEWLEYEGTGVCPVWGGGADLGVLG